MQPPLPHSALAWDNLLVDGPGCPELEDSGENLTGGPEYPPGRTGSMICRCNRLAPPRSILFPAPFRGLITLDYLLDLAEVVGGDACKVIDADLFQEL